MLKLNLLFKLKKCVLQQYYHEGQIEQWIPIARVAGDFIVAVYAFSIAELQHNVEDSSVNEVDHRHIACLANPPLGTRPQLL